MKVFGVLLFLSIVSACSWKKDGKLLNVESDNGGGFLSLVSEKKFYLDNRTPVLSRSIRYLEKDSCLVCYENYSNVLVVFDYESGLIREKISLKSTNISPHNLYVWNLDSILVYSIDKQEIYLLNRFCDIVNTYDVAINNTLKAFTLTPKLSTIQPAWSINNEWYIIMGGLGEFPKTIQNRLERPVWAVLKSDGKIDRFLSGFPEFYIHHNMGSFTYWDPRGTYNPVQKKLVVTFRASSQLAVLDIQNEEEMFYTLKSHYFDTIPLPHKGEDRDYVSQQESYLHYLIYPSFEAIIYDQYQNVYYRFILHGNVEPDLSKGAKAYFDKDFSVMVLDENMEIIGESSVFEGHYIPQSFITQEGLHVLRITGNEDVATYSVFKLGEID